MSGNHSVIHWLIQSLDDCPEILRSGWAPSWLGDNERQQLATFRVEKRRQEWLLGRWTAKRLTQTVLHEDGADDYPLHELLIAADASGAPFVMLSAAKHLVATSSCGQATGTKSQRLPFSLSISHSHSVAFCAIARIDHAHDDPGITHHPSRSAQPPSTTAGRPTQRAEQTSLAVGADIEFVEARTATFVVDFFTPTEQASIAVAPVEQRDLLSTAIWSAKEAVLKALHEGLRIDTRLVECLVELSDPPPQEWTPFSIRVDMSIEGGSDHASAWSGWWRVHQDRYVLTLAVRSLTV